MVRASLLVKPSFLTSSLEANLKKGTPKNFKFWAGCFYKGIDPKIKSFLLPTSLASLFANQTFQRRRTYLIFKSKIPSFLEKGGPKNTYLWAAILIREQQKKRRPQPPLLCVFAYVFCYRSCFFSRQRLGSESKRHSHSSRSFCQSRGARFTVPASTSKLPPTPMLTRQPSSFRC